MTQLPKKKFTKKDEGFTKIKGIKKESSEDSRDYLFKSMKSEAIRNEFSYFPEK